MKDVIYKLPENLEECNSIGSCNRCYLSMAQSLLRCSPGKGECFFRKEFVNYKFLSGNFSRGKSMNDIELEEYRKRYKPNERCMKIIENKLKDYGLL